jgi:hypothetical protein
MSVSRLAVHPMIVAVAMGLLAPQSLTSLGESEEPEVGSDDPADAADDLLRFEADLASLTSSDFAPLPLAPVDPAEFARIEALWHQTA